MYKGVGALVSLAALVLTAGASAAGVSGDFDGDGRDDLAAGVGGQQVGGSTGAGAVQVIYGSPNGLSSRDRIFNQNVLQEFAEPGDNLGSVLAAGDLNGDGFSDLVAGVPLDDLNGVGNAGVVHILYGSKQGLRTKGNQLLTEADPGIGGSAEENDRFGYVLATGDLGRGGEDDLAITVRDETVDGASQAGMVYVLYGSPTGLRRAGSRHFSQNTPGIADSAENGDGFGGALAAGDFGRDRRADLAIGVDSEGWDTVSRAGAVHVLYGSRSGLRAKRSQLLTQNKLAGYPGQLTDEAETNDFFGTALAAGEFGRGTRADLAIGAPGETLVVPAFDTFESAGVVNVVYGAARGLRAKKDASQYLIQNEASSINNAEDNEFFGQSLVAGDLGRGHHADLAVSAPQETSVLGAANSGGVNVIYGSASGLRLNKQGDYFDQDSPGVEGDADEGDQFGWQLTAGVFDGNGAGDLAIGIPNEDPPLGGPDPQPLIANGGAVQVLHGFSAGVLTKGDRLITQGHDGLGGVIEASDHFGAGLAGALSGLPYG